MLGLMSKSGINEIVQPQVWKNYPFDKIGFLKGVAKIFAGSKNSRKPFPILNSFIIPSWGNVMERRELAGKSNAHVSLGIPLF